MSDGLSSRYSDAKDEEISVHESSSLVNVNFSTDNDTSVQKDSTDFSNGMTLLTETKEEWFTYSFKNTERGCASDEKLNMARQNETPGTHTKFWKNLNKLAQWCAYLQESYVTFLMQYAGRFLIAHFGISILLTAFAIWFYGGAFSVDPRIGFETRSTELANRRIAVQNVIAMQAQIYPIVKPRKAIRKRALSDQELSRMAKKFLSTPCRQYSYTGGSLFPYEKLDAFSKVVFQVASIDKLFRLDVMSRLCYIDQTIDDILQEMSPRVNEYKKIPFSFNLPYYGMCFAKVQQPSNCSNLNETIISSFANLTNKCLDDISLEQCTQSYFPQMSKLIFGREDGKFNPHGPVYIAAVLPITIGGTEYKFYDKVFKKLQKNFNDNDLKLIGAYFGIKPYAFQKLIITDIFYGIISSLLVTLIIFLYTSSFLLTLSVSLSLILSIGVAFFVYTALMRVHFFPFLNLLAIVLIIAVGADDVFLFIYQFRKHNKASNLLLKQRLKVVKERYLKEASVLSQTMLSDNEVEGEKKDKTSYSEEVCKAAVDLQIRDSLNTVLSHAAVAMFVTSATTAIAFYTNFISRIVVLRCFGLYAGTAMIINYLFVITVLPATVILFKTKPKKPQYGYFCRRVHQVGQFFTSKVSSVISKIFVIWIPEVVSYTRFFFLPLSIGALALAIYAIVKNPGIRLPDKNHLQLLRADHPYEWYDENAKSLFDFTSGNRRKMNLLAVWGVQPAETASAIDPYSYGTLQVNNKFSIFMSKNLQTFADLVSLLVERYGSNTTDDLWINYFVKWANKSKGRCDELLKPSLVQDNVTLLHKCLLEFNTRNPIVLLFDLSLQTIDGPIYSNNGQFLGYFLVTQSRFNASLLFYEMKPFFNSFAEMEHDIKNFSVQESSHPILIGPIKSTLLYDLLEQILNGTGISVLVSLTVSLVVIAAITRHLSLSLFSIISIAVVVLLTVAIVLWIGWTVNVVEATIIVLTIGMSFDYTLHFAVAFKIEGIQNVRSVYSLVSVPVLLAAASSFVAGVGLIAARTQPFFEIGFFLMIVTSTSLIIALFVLPSYVTTFHRKSLVTQF